jgi:hypothetical protein
MERPVNPPAPDLIRIEAHQGQAADRPARPDGGER